jgi:hypothetical protein
VSLVVYGLPADVDRAAVGACFRVPVTAVRFIAPGVALLRPAALPCGPRRHGSVLCGGRRCAWFRPLWFV